MNEYILAYLGNEWASSFVVDILHYGKKWVCMGNC